VDGSQLSLLQPEEEEPAPAIAALAKLNPDALSPRQALDWLYRLKGML